MGTKENLQAAFAGESQANRRYLAFAGKAEREGYHHIAKLFRAAAAAETVHALAHLRNMGGIRSTTENVQVAIEGEGYEYREMYPQFVEEAVKEGNKPAETMFRFAMAVEGVHHGLYSRAAEALKDGKDLPQERIHVCSVCGNTFVGQAPEKCPVCGAPKSKFNEVE